jgi:sortase (surface protein transpeptidase)
VTDAKHRYQSVRTHRLSAVVSVVLLAVGAVLITLAAYGSRAGPPQPTPAAVGVIEPQRLATPASRDQATLISAEQATATPPETAAALHTVATGPTQDGKSTAPAMNGATAKRSTVPHPAGVAAKGLILKKSQPVALSIPAIKVTSPLLDLGLNADGTLQVPSLDDPRSKAGWYRNSPTPGSLGPAIIVGHIDSKKYGPGVFYELGSLMPGQEIDIARKDGTVAVFRVDGVRSYPKDHFPTLDVYGNIDHAGLRLITCGGTFDPERGSYENNIVVYASLTSSRSA